MLHILLRTYWLDLRTSTILVARGAEAGLKKKSVTLFLLWQEYKKTCPGGYEYSWFCRNYAEWANKIDVVMRFNHRAGETLFVDYAGQTIPIIDKSTGEIRESQIFVATLGTSNYTYAEATWTQSLPDWIGSHTRAFKFLGGVPEIIVPDNIKTGINTSCRYEPDLNPTYQDMASHYGCAIIPARVRHPKDKAKVESGVKTVGAVNTGKTPQHNLFQSD
jgi:transposase